MLADIARRFALGVLLGLLSTSTAWGQAADSSKPEETPALLARELAALQAFRTLVASHSYELSEKQLQEMVEEYLRKRSQTSQPPHAAPRIEDLQGVLASEFDQEYEGMIRTATSGLDPDRSLGLEARLRKQLDTDGRLRTVARARHAEYLQNRLPELLRLVTDRIVKTQLEELQRVLVDFLKRGHPSAQEIEAAWRGGSEAALASAIGQSVIAEVSVDIREGMLHKAHERLQSQAEQVVTHGVAELKEQLAVLEAQPDSFTLEGIEKELRFRLDAMVNRQAATPEEEDPLRPVYGLFDAAEQGAKDWSSRHFDGRVADAAREVSEAIKQGKRPLPREHAQAIQDRILRAIPTHHRSALSKTQLQPVIRTMVGTDRQWITEGLLSAAGRTSSPHDRDFSLPRLKDDTDRLLKTEGTGAERTWLRLKDLLEQKYENELLPAVREAIATAHAGHYAPTLLNGQWRPTEEEIRRLPHPPQEQHIRRVRVWQQGPPKTEAVLEETWQLWLRGAQASLALGRTALREQDEIVVSLKPTVYRQMLDAPGRTANQWVSNYTQLVSQQWRQKQSDAARRYPELFQGIREKIAALVALLLKEVEREHERELQRQREEAKRRAEQLRLEAAREAEKPPEEPEPNVPSQSETEEHSGTSASHDMSDSEMPGGDPGEGGPGGPGRGSGEVADSQEIILTIQNEIIDGLVPEVAEEIRQAFDERGETEQTYWKQRYEEHAVAAWRQHVQSQAYPELLPSVAERVEGVVVRLLTPAHLRMEQRAQTRQLAMLEEECAGNAGGGSLVDMIHADPNANHALYEQQLLDAVAQQWTGDTSEEVVWLRREYPDLLPGVKAGIGEAVARAMASRPAEEDGEELKEAASPSSGDDGFGEGDSPSGFQFRFYQIGFWTLLFLLLVMAGCWYWNLRYLKAYIAARRLAD